MLELVTIVAGMIAIFVGIVKGNVWMRRRIKNANKRRVRERTLDSNGELERGVWLLADKGADARAIAQSLKVRRSTVRRLLRNWE